MTAIREFQEIQNIVILFQADFVGAVLRITRHVTGEIPEYLVDTREEVETAFSRVRTGSDLRRALTLLQSK